MQNQTATAAKITATVRDITKGDTVFNDYVVASQETTDEKNATVEKTLVTLITKIDAPVVQFIAEVVKFKDGRASFSFSFRGTEDLNDFLKALETI